MSNPVYVLTCKTVNARTVTTKFGEKNLKEVEVNEMPQKLTIWEKKSYGQDYHNISVGATLTIAGAMEWKGKAGYESWNLHADATISVTGGTPAPAIPTPPQPAAPAAAPTQYQPVTTSPMKDLMRELISSNKVLASKMEGIANSLAMLGRILAKSEGAVMPAEAVGVSPEVAGIIPSEEEYEIIEDEEGY